MSWAFGIGVGALCLTIGLTFAVLVHVASVQTDHNQTLAQIQAVGAQTKVLAQELKADEIQAAKGSKTVAVILIDAAAAVKVLETQEAAICAATPGCHL
jgi:hypothetical protein